MQIEIEDNTLKITDDQEFINSFIDDILTSIAMRYFYLLPTEEKFEILEDFLLNTNTPPKEA